MNTSSNAKFVRVSVGTLLFMVSFPATLLTMKGVIFSFSDVPISAIESIASLSIEKTLECALPNLSQCSDADYIRSVVKLDQQKMNMLKEGWVNEIRQGYLNVRIQFALWVIVDVISIFLLFKFRRKRDEP